MQIIKSDIEREKDIAINMATYYYKNQPDHTNTTGYDSLIIGKLAQEFKAKYDYYLEVYNRMRMILDYWDMNLWVVNPFEYKPAYIENYKGMWLRRKKLYFYYNGNTAYVVEKHFSNFFVAYKLDLAVETGYTLARFDNLKEAKKFVTQQ